MQQKEYKVIPFDFYDNIAEKLNELCKESNTVVQVESSFVKRKGEHERVFLLVSFTKYIDEF